MLKRLSASSGLVPGGPRSSTLAAPCLPMHNMLVFSQPTDFRSALGRVVGAPLSDDDWRLASLGISSGSAPGPPVSTPLQLTLVASPLAAISALLSGLPSTPQTSTRSAAWLPPRAPLVLPSSPVPVSMLSLMPLPRGPCRPRSKPKLSPCFFRILPSPGLVVFTLMLAVLQVLALGSATCTSLHRSSGWLCSAASACPFGTAMPPAGFAARFWIGGVTVTGSFATTLSANLCAPLSMSSLLFPPSWRNRASWSLPGPLIPVAPAPAPILALIFTVPLAAGAVPLTFGSPGVPQASLRHGTSPSRPSFAPPFFPASPSVAGVFLEVETRKNLISEHCLSGCCLGCCFPSAGLGGLPEGGGPQPFVRSSHGFPRSRVLRVAWRRHSSGRQPSDCTAHQLHPSSGKRACNP